MLLQEIYKKNISVSFSDLTTNKELNKQIQTILISHELLFPPADGIWGNKSNDALKEFITVTKLKSVAVDKQLAELLIETKEIVLLPEKSVAANESEVISFTGKIDWQHPNCYISKHFTVAEVTQNDRRRIPKVGSESERNILLLGKELDNVRDVWGYPLGVTSWNRPEPINGQVGGVRGSKHTEGLAADVYPLAGGNVYDLQKWLDLRWFGRLGYGAAKGFVHLDIDNGKGYMTKGAKGVRWNY